MYNIVFKGRTVLINGNVAGDIVSYKEYGVKKYVYECLEFTVTSSKLEGVKNLITARYSDWYSQTWEVAYFHELVTGDCILTAHGCVIVETVKAGTDPTVTVKLNETLSFVINCKDNHGGFHRLVR